MRCETVEVETENGLVVINKSDFDSKIHKKAAKKEPKKDSKKAAKKEPETSK